MRARATRSAVVITEYTSFGFGDLDDGQEANAQTGFALDIASTLLSHYRQGVDAALYWDAVDYLQPGHDADDPLGLPARARRQTLRAAAALLRNGADPGLPAARARVLLDVRAVPIPGQSGVQLADGRPVIFWSTQVSIHWTCSSTWAGRRRQLPRHSSHADGPRRREAPADA